MGEQLIRIIVIILVKVCDNHNVFCVKLQPQFTTKQLKLSL